MACRPTNTLIIVLSLLACCLSASGQQVIDEESQEPELRLLDEAPPEERELIDKLIGSPSWVRRALGAVRLERYEGERSATMLARLVKDNAWQVRCFAIRTCAHRRLEIEASIRNSEEHPRVVRTYLRHRYNIELSRVANGVRALTSERRSLEDNVLGAELAAASAEPSLEKQARAAIRRVILRMSRETSGRLGPRLGVLTHTVGIHRDYEWVRWYRKNGQLYKLRPGYLVPPREIPEHLAPVTPTQIAALDFEVFRDLVRYIEELSVRDLDLCITIDCTSSMWACLGDAQASMNDMLLFAGDILRSMRVAVVGYRDRRDEFETRAWDFSSNINVVQSHLWELSASGGGDSPEMVYEALKIAYQQCSWDLDHTMNLILVGDGPPHVGRGSHCIAMAADGADHGCITHVIEARGRDVKHFPEIAKAGGGRCLKLEDGQSLVAEITGLTIGDRFDDEFREFFQVYLQLCR